MTEEISCPVCDRRGLLPDCKCCPQCDADLACFQDLDRLRAESGAPATKDCAVDIPTNRFARIFVFACVFSGVMAIAAVSFFMGRFDRRLAGMDKTISVATHDKGLQQDVDTAHLHINKLEVHYKDSFFRLEKAVKGNAIEIERTGAMITNLEKGLDKRFAAVLSQRADIISPAAVSKMTAPSCPDNTFLYYARKTDTLWAIAHRFYGNGKYYPLIMEQNPHLIISNITEKSEMQIISNPDPVILADMYCRKTERKKGILLWRHVVQPGETRDSIYTRFTAPGAPRQVFFDTGAKIVPFEMIKIILR